MRVVLMLLFALSRMGAQQFSVRLALTIVAEKSEKDEMTTCISDALAQIDGVVLDQFAPQYHVHVFSSPNRERTAGLWVGKLPDWPALRKSLHPASFAKVRQVLSQYEYPELETALAPNPPTVQTLCKGVAYMVDREVLEPLKAAEKRYLEMLRDKPGAPLTPDVFIEQQRNRAAKPPKK